MKTLAGSTASMGVLMQRLTLWRFDRGHASRTRKLLLTDAAAPAQQPGLTAPIVGGASARRTPKSRAQRTKSTTSSTRCVGGSASPASVSVIRPVWLPNARRGCKHQRCRSGSNAAVVIPASGSGDFHNSRVAGAVTVARLLRIVRCDRVRHSDRGSPALASPPSGSPKAPAERSGSPA